MHIRLAVLFGVALAQVACEGTAGGGASDFGNTLTGPAFSLSTDDERTFQVEITASDSALQGSLEFGAEALSVGYANVDDDFWVELQKPDPENPGEWGPVAGSGDSPERWGGQEFVVGITHLFPFDECLEACTLQRRIRFWLDGQGELDVLEWTTFMTNPADHSSVSIQAIGWGPEAVE